MSPWESLWMPWKLHEYRGKLNAYNFLKINKGSNKLMSKPHRTIKKANHGSRPANSKARKAKRKHIKT